MAGLGSPLLLLIFLAAAAVTWAAGITLSKSTDALDARLGLGDAVGGLVLLAIAGSLPELAITISAASQGNLGLAAGNLIGGIAVQTMVLLICDIAVGPQRPLTFLVGRLTPVLEALLVIIVVAGVEMGALLKPSTAIAGTVSPASLGIVIFWLVGLYAIRGAAKDPRWKVTMPGSQPGRRRRERAQPDQPHPYAGLSTAGVAAIFGLASLVTLGAGVALVKHLTSIKWATKFAQIRRVLTANIEADKAVLDSVKTEDPLAYAVMQTQLEHTDKMTGNWPLANDAQIKEAFWPEFQNAVLGRKDAKTALADAERGVAKVLRRA